MAASLCSQCQAELPQGVAQCPNCGLTISVVQSVDFAPAFAGAALFVVVLLICEWLQVVWPVALGGVALLVFLVVRYGRLAYVPPAPRPVTIEAEVPVEKLLEKVEVPEPAEEKQEVTEPVCLSCGAKRDGAPRFCGNCGQPFPV